MTEEVLGMTEEANMAVYTSIRRASIIGMMKRYGDALTSLGMTECACATRVSNVPTARSGLPEPKHSPLAVDTPTRRPVYDPGPMLTHTASQSASFTLRSSSTSCTKTAVREAWALGAELSRYAVMLPFSASATEHSAVDVSINTILLMITI